MKIIETKVYTFDELNDAAKEVAREWWRRGQDGDNSFSEYVIEDAETCGEFIGIEIDKRAVKLCGGGTSQSPAVFFSGFSSQGDGACFEGSWRASDVKPGKLQEHAPQDKELHRIAGEFERLAMEFPQASFTVKHSGRYSHKYCTDFTVDITGDNEVALNECGETAANQAEKDLIEAARDFMQWIYDSLEKEWTWQNADEQVDDNIRANEYTFTEDGRQF